MSAKRRRVELSQPSPVKSEDEERPQESEEVPQESPLDPAVAQTAGVEDLAPYHEFHRFKPKKVASSVSKHIGLNLDTHTLGIPLLAAFFQRYSPLESTEANGKLPSSKGLHWNFSYERKGNEVKATLTACALNGQRFEGKWSINDYQAEQSATKVFRDDPEVREIAKKLPPSMKRIRENLRFNKQERALMENARIRVSDVTIALSRAVYMQFRDKFHCRTALWDGNA
ncbi:unnamed protein product [Cladocopium goreaui]|uniref:Uncharacterized protein n=1 Tax=Cladocopium goreaui TaxID=2562237 RepID=A0A9P1C9U8_9DINO|nr:unnamed protein product [Cladocopium goreaui]